MIQVALCSLLRMIRALCRLPTESSASKMGGSSMRSAPPLGPRPGAKAREIEDEFSARARETAAAGHRLAGRCDGMPTGAGAIAGPGIPRGGALPFGAAGPLG